MSKNTGMVAKEFWEVSVGNTKYEGEGGIVYVGATSASMAEKRALAVKESEMKRTNGKVEGKFYVRSAEYVGEVYI